MNLRSLEFLLSRYIIFSFLRQLLFSVSQAYGIDLSVSDFLMVILTATLASIGTAGVPGVGLIMLAMVLQQVGLPVEGIALIIGVDRLLDMLRTSVNVCGDSMIACIISSSENNLRKEIFYDQK